jgi:putative oxidoreductase
MEPARAIGRLAVVRLPAFGSWLAIPLRLIVGFGFIAHGYAKLTRGPEEFIAILHAIGMPFASLLGWATILVEIVGGLMVLFGTFVLLATGR